MASNLTASEMATSLADVGALLAAGGGVADLAGRLDAATLMELRRLLALLRTEASVDGSVLLLQALGQVTPPGVLRSGVPRTLLRRFCAAAIREKETIAKGLLGAGAGTTHCATVAGGAATPAAGGAVMLLLCLRERIARLHVLGAAASMDTAAAAPLPPLPLSAAAADRLLNRLRARLRAGAGVEGSAAPSSPYPGAALLDTTRDVVDTVTAERAIAAAAARGGVAGWWGELWRTAALRVRDALARGLLTWLAYRVLHGWATVRVAAAARRAAAVQQEAVAQETAAHAADVRMAAARVAAAAASTAAALSATDADDGEESDECGICLCALDAPSPFTSAVPYSAATPLRATYDGAAETVWQRQLRLFRPEQPAVGCAALATGMLLVQRPRVAATAVAAAVAAAAGGIALRATWRCIAVAAVAGQQQLDAPAAAAAAAGERRGEESGISVVTLRCGHRFHRHCLAQWAARGGTCPLCRTPLPRSAGLPGGGGSSFEGGGEDEGEGGDGEGGGGSGNYSIDGCAADALQRYNRQRVGSSSSRASRLRLLLDFWDGMALASDLAAAREERRFDHAVAAERVLMERRREKLKSERRQEWWSADLGGSSDSRSEGGGDVSW